MIQALRFLVPLLALASSAVWATAGSVTFIKYRLPDMDFQRPEGCPKDNVACSNAALGRWLPVLIDNSDKQGLGQVRIVDFTDSFAYEGPAKPVRYWGDIGGYPQDGTGIIYSRAVVKADAVYDYAHHIAYYDQGCCDWRDVVLAGDVAPPPLRVVNRNLQSLSTGRGVHLGDELSQVRAAYGAAALHAVPHYPDLRMLSYYPSVQPRLRPSDDLCVSRGTADLRRSGNGVLSGMLFPIDGGEV